LWRATYQGYRNAAKAYLNVKTQTAVNTKEEDTSADFSQEKPQVHLDYKTPVPLPDQARSEARGPEQRETGISVATIGKVVSGFRSILWRGTGKTEPAPKPAFRRTF